MSQENTQQPTPTKPAHIPEGALYINTIDIDAQGIARKEDGKVIFIEGALTGEWVNASTYKKKNQWEAAHLTNIYQESNQRVTPKCPHFGLHQTACGGCKMQHIDTSTQVAYKQKILEDNLWHLGKVKPEQIMRPIQGPDWGYRYRARMSVRYVQKKGEILIGFHERKSRYIADMQTCAILPAHISKLLMPLRALIKSLDAKETCPQIELAASQQTTALVLRHLEPLSPEDIEKLKQFGKQNQIQWWLQPKGPDAVHRLDQNDGTTPLAYQISDYGLTMPFRPTDFTQVNPHINNVMITRALKHLAPQNQDISSETIIDWFCGLGNFTLPIATLNPAKIIGIEGSKALVERAKQNAQKAGLEKADFQERNLFDMTAKDLLKDPQADRWLIDPPREGAFALTKSLAALIQAKNQTNPEYEPEQIQELTQNPETKTALKNWQPPKKIVYVSCNPATLARDAGLLVHIAGYKLKHAGIMNMFAHTAHVESMAIFELETKDQTQN